MIEHPLAPCRDADALSAEVRRVAGALLDDAIRLTVVKSSGSEDRRVHEARKRLKEARSLLRLVRGSLVDAGGDRIRSRENGALKSAADQLGDARDAAVMVETLDKLTAACTQETASDAFADLRRRLVARHKSLKTAGIGFEAAAEILKEARGRIDGWRLDAGRKGRAWDALSPGLAKIYADGRDDLKTARNSGEAGLWHDWRKRVKDLRYALELLRTAAPALLGGMIDAADTLGGDLGDDHDLAVLLATVRGEPDLCDDAAAATLESLVARGSDELRTKADRDAGQVYAESSKAFVKRVDAYWRNSD